MPSDQFSPYKDTFVNTNGPGDQRPTALQVVKDNDCIGQWSGKVVLITGATSGIGLETARAIHATGADLFITARNTDKAQEVIEDIQSTSGGKRKIETLEVHMESLESVKNAANEFLAKSKQLNVLINNAGVMATPETKSEDGFELQFAVNQLAHYTMTSLLLPTLVSSSTPGFKSRVVHVASSSHRYRTFHWDNFNFTGEYDPFLAYGSSKTAQIWTSNYVDRKFGPRGVHSLAIHPGGIWTNLLAHAGEEQIKQWKSNVELSRCMQSAEQGASTTVWAAVGRVWEGKGGKYLADCSITSPTENLTDALNSGYAPWVYDEEAEGRMWNLCAELTGVMTD
ncbi:putative short-chain dehydrogenase [Aulographum hederae CBS 113979]|uniref:Putative short-chain dehydrogenase n=1 Tax=Aulographum hederae CBS 113979 TaxID=1176131 RepID=A0A6G1H6J5_9PEZI|nr:putative short-chain dehydrogenase [Aulographum hederae CBS 113979]